MVATVELIERMRTGQEAVASYLHVLEIDAFSAGALNYGIHAIRADISGAPTYSMERWFRWRFEQPFTYIADVLFWTPGLTVPQGWTLLYGTSETFVQPTNAPSSIAVSALPMTKPVSPNVGGVPPMDGTETRYSDWIVLQASVNADADIGPMLGFMGNDPVNIEYRLDWTES